MRAGKVVSIRVNPADCMSVIDILDEAGFDLSRLGMANAASIVLSMLLEDRRAKGMIPRRLGFEYLNMVSKLDQTKGNSKIKMAASTALYENAMRGIHPAFEGTRVSQGTAIQEPASNGVWVGDMFLPNEYQSWDDMKKIAWQEAQQILLDERKPVMISAEGWSP